MDPQTEGSAWKQPGNNCPHGTGSSTSVGPRDQPLGKCKEKGHAGDSVSVQQVVCPVL